MTPHEFISVEGARVEAVNGVYHRVDTFNVGIYSKIGLYQGKNQEFSLFRCNVSSGTLRWYISIVPFGEQPGTSTDIDFYCVDKSETDPDFPPSTGWTTESEGCDPSPSVSVERIGGTLKSLAETYKKNSLFRKV
jgi:hypothetical protein